MINQISGVVIKVSRPPGIPMTQAYQTKVTVDSGMALDEVTVKALPADLPKVGDQVDIVISW